MLWYRSVCDVVVQECVMLWYRSVCDVVVQDFMLPCMGVSAGLGLIGSGVGN